ncbi:MAG: hypothetical protein GXX79_00565 [Actinomycetales bacterium]|nr:hypothetical protein [Actinomycetales bacterium]
MSERPLRIHAVADSDSYLKWAAGLLSTVPGHWDRRLEVVRSPIAPSPSQIADAVAATAFEDREVPQVTLREFRRTVLAAAPDAVLLACTGPVVDALIRELSEVRAHLVLVTGLPGISIPATVKAWLYRGATDLFVVHSRREVRDFDALRRMLSATGTVGLATLPFLSAVPASAAGAGDRRSVVFAPQAKVPRDADDRVRILHALADLALARSDLDVVVKLRARTGEEQTHRETDGYDLLWNDLVAQGTVTDGCLGFETGPMAEHLLRAAGFVTVSSTAAVEAMAQRVPLLVLDDFGVSGRMINKVFEGSGCLGSLGDLRAARFRLPAPEWLADNYFHPPEENDWMDRLAALVEARRAGDLAPAQSLLDGRHHWAARVRSRNRLTLRPSTLRFVSRVRSMAR